MDLFIDELLHSNKKGFLDFIELILLCHDSDHSFNCPLFYRVKQALEVCFTFGNQHLWRVFRLKLAKRKTVEMFFLLVFFSFSKAWTSSVIDWSPDNILIAWSSILSKCDRKPSRRWRNLCVQTPLLLEGHASLNFFV